MSDSLFVPKNPIETIKELQWDIGMSHPEVASDLAKQAIELTGDISTVYGSKKLIVHAMSGYVLNRLLTIDEQIYNHQFNEMTVIGYLGGVPYVQKLDNPKL